MRTRLLALLVLVVTVAGTLAAGSKMSYVYKRGDNSWMRASGNSIRTLQRVAKKYGPEFIWIEQNGREYVITSVSVLTAARQLFGEMDAESEPLRAIEARLRPHEREMEKVEERLDTLSDSLDDDDLSESRRATVERQIRELEEQMRVVESRMHGVEKELERLEKELEKKEEEIEARFEKLVEQAIREGKATQVE